MSLPGLYCTANHWHRSAVVVLPVVILITSRLLMSVYMYINRLQVLISVEYDLMKGDLLTDPVT